MPGSEERLRGVEVAVGEAVDEASHGYPGTEEGGGQVLTVGGPRRRFGRDAGLPAAAAHCHAVSSEECAASYSSLRRRRGHCASTAAVVPGAAVTGRTVTTVNCVGVVLPVAEAGLPGLGDEADDSQQRIVLVETSARQTSTPILMGGYLPSRVLPQPLTFLSTGRRTVAMRRGDSSDGRAGTRRGGGRM